jgi:hypothetical protein
MLFGSKGFLQFTFGRAHDIGLLQQVSATPGDRLRFSIWAHAWSNHKDDSKGDKFPEPDNPRWSEGAGFGPFFKLEGTAASDEERNFTFWVGVDPTGGTDPTADTVQWGQGAHIYNIFHEVPPVEVVAQASTVTVFTRSRAIWPFKHNDAYWDNAVLSVVIPAPPDPKPGRGEPREQYKRTYVLLSFKASKAWANAVVDATWDRNRYTIGSSADDSGIGNLDHRYVLAVNPDEWGPGADGRGLLGFIEAHYEGVVAHQAVANTPDDLAALLSSTPFEKLPALRPYPAHNGDPPPPPPPGREIVAPHIQHGWIHMAEGYIRQHQPIVKLVDVVEKAKDVVSWGGQVLYRPFFGDYKPFIDHPNPSLAAPAFLDSFWDSLMAQGDKVAFLQGLNETVEDVDTVRRSVAFEIAVIRELEARGWPGRYVALTPSVGQPPQDTMELLRPLVDELMRTGNLMGANCYWPISLPKDAQDDQFMYRHPSDSWASYAGRFETIREVLGVDFPVIVTESGACAWEDNGGGWDWAYRKGWRDCYDDFGEFVEHAVYVRDRYLAAGGVLAMNLFTTGDWESFHLGPDEWAFLEEALSA